jgi:DNA-binding NarL/FixJ family response regulator
METDAPIRVLIAEDDDGVREVLASVVRSHPALELAGAVADAAGAILAAGAHRPHVALVDVRMPGGGPAASLGIRERSPQTAVLAFSAHDDARTMREMEEAGAVGYLVKGSSVAAIVAAIERAAGLTPARVTHAA